MPPQYNNRGNRENRDNRDNDRDPRNRESGPSVQRPTPVITQSNTFVPVQTQPQPQMQPTQNRPQVPIFNPEAPLQNQRQSGPQPAPQIQQGPQQARPVDDERPKGKRNKRENQDRDFQ